MPTIRGRKAAFAGAGSARLIDELRRLRENGRVYFKPAQRQAFDDFLARRSAAVLLSTSSFQSTLLRAKFPFQVMYPPYLRSKSINTAGGDIVLPFNPKKTLTEKDRSDMRVFIEWFYGGKGDAFWAMHSSMFLLTRAGDKCPLYRAAIAERPDRGKLFDNSDRWAVRSWYELDDSCNAVRVRQVASKVVQDAVDSANSALVLAQADGFLNRLLASGTCP